MPEFQVHTPAGRIRVVIEKPPRAASLYYRFHLHGRRHYASTKTNDIRRAKQLARAAVEKAANTESRSTLTLGQLAAQFLEARQSAVAADTHDNLQTRLALFCDGRDLVDIGTMTFREAVELCQAHLDTRRHKSARTVKNDQLALSAFMGWINKRHGLWPNNPASAAFLDLPHIQPRAPKTISEGALRAFLEAASEDPVFPVVILCLSGLRPKAACSLLWTQIDFASASITVSGKTGERIMPLGAWAVSKLKPLALAPAEKIWPHHHDTAHDAVARLRAGIDPGITLNRLRATGERMLWESGTSPTIAARIMGHSVETAQRHYVDLQSIHAQDAANAISPHGRRKNRRNEKRLIL